MNTRALATQLMMDVFIRGQSLSTCLPKYKKQCKNPEDAAFLQALTFGVIRWHNRLDYLSQKLLQKPIKRKEIAIYYLILIGLYQLSQMRTPEHAAISETVKVTRFLNKPWATSLVNAVLRQYQRESQNLEASIIASKEAYYSHPLWLIQKIQNAWQDNWETILTNNNLQAPLTLRVNLLKNSREEYLKRLNSIDIPAQPLSPTNTGILLETPVDVTTLPGFSEGFFSVQDGASQLVVPLLQLSPNLRVLDACAAPGGKTAHILESETKLAELIAIDISKERTQLIKDNLNRLNLKATVLTGDANNPNSWWNGELFDRILLDAPCSATGVIRRHPDIKCLRKESDLKQLTERQLQLLAALWPLLKPNGLLLYTTCSIFPEENMLLVQKFLATQPNAFAEQLPSFNPNNQPVGHQIFPGQNNMDGFYYALIRKDIT